MDRWNSKPGRLDEEVVFLTNLPVRDALRVFDQYDDRSSTETCVNKEAKQNWHLARAPQRTQHAMNNHIFMVLMLMGLTRAYRSYQQRMDCDPHAINPAFDPLDFRRWRRQVQHDNAGKVIVSVGEVFGILPLIEFSALISDTVHIRGAPTCLSTTAS